MYPEDPPFIALPTELSDETVARLHEILLELARGLEYHYAAQIRRYYEPPDGRQPDLWEDEEPIF
jgi:hypothetical protein